MLRTVPESEMVDALLEEIAKWEAEEATAGRLDGEKRPAEKGKVRLPVLS